MTLVYQHEPPNVPGKSIKGVLVEYGPGGYSPAHTHPKSAFIYATVLEGAIRSLSGSPLRATGIVLRPAASSHLSQLAHQFFRFCDVSLQRTAGDLRGEVGHVDDHRGASQRFGQAPSRDGVDAESGDAANALWPCSRSLVTSLNPMSPMSPVPPMTTIFIALLHFAVFPSAHLVARCRGSRRWMRR